MQPSSVDIKRRLRRAKESERRMGRWLLKYDGPDTRFMPGAGLVTTTGRVGHVTGLQFDTLSRTYAGENKQQKVWAGLWGFWKKIVERATAQGKEPLLRIEPTNEDKAGVPIMHIITEERHAQLLDFERQMTERVVVGVDLASGLDETVVVTLQGSKPVIRDVVRPYSKEQQAGRKRRK